MPRLKIYIAEDNTEYRESLIDLLKGRYPGDLDFVVYTSFNNFQESYDDECRLLLLTMN
jgi:hypothetical protein